jgi:hypothetical protein
LNIPQKIAECSEGESAEQAAAALKTNDNYVKATSAHVFYYFAEFTKSDSITTRNFPDKVRELINRQTTSVSLTPKLNNQET